MRPQSQRSWVRNQQELSHTNLAPTTQIQWAHLTNDQWASLSKRNRKRKELRNNWNQAQRRSILTSLARSTPVSKNKRLFNSQDRVTNARPKRRMRCLEGCRLNLLQSFWLRRFRRASSYSKSRRKIRKLMTGELTSTSQMKVIRRNSLTMSESTNDL